MLIINHIPKTAGTTLRVIMENQYPEESVYKIKHRLWDEVEDFKKTSDDFKRKIEVIFGHFCYGVIHPSLPHDISFQHITVLRDPIKRAVSLYTYILESPTHYLHNAARSMDQARFFSSGITSTFDNAQVRQLCGSDRFTQTVNRDMLIPFRGVTQDHLWAARENLKEFLIVGLVEEWDSVLGQLTEKLGWKTDGYPKFNVSRRKQKIVPEAMRVIEDTNQLDIELYNWVRGRICQ